MQSILALSIAAALFVVAVLAAACGGLTHNSPQPQTIATASVPAGTATVFAGTPLSLRTPTLPMDSTCHLIFNHATSTANDLAQGHGEPRSCYQLDRLVLLEMPGATSDPRPGYLACTQPPAATDDYCGVGLAPVIARVPSYAAHWQFLPFPTLDGKTVGGAAFPQQYQCVGNVSQMWTFHFDTLVYTAGCSPPPSTTNGSTPCDGFMYLGMGTLPDLYATYGKPVGCQLYGSTAVGVVDGKAQPGVLVCGPVTPVAQLRKACGFDLGVPPVSLDAWHFVALPVPSGPVDSAAFDTAAGTACLSVGAQHFTFTLATMSVTPGCGAAPAPSATP